MKKSIVVKSEYTAEELKKYYLLNCQHDDSCNWRGLSKDVLDIVENEDDTVDFICPNCNKVLTILK